MLSVTSVQQFQPLLQFGNVFSAAGPLIDGMCISYDGGLESQSLKAISCQ